MDDQLRQTLIQMFLDSSQILFTIKDAARALGKTPQTLRAMCRAGHGPRFQTNDGKHLYFAKCDLMEWVNNQPTYQSTEEFYQANPSLRPVDRQFESFKKQPKPPLTCMPGPMGSQG